MYVTVCVLLALPTRRSSDLQEDMPPLTALEDSILYELHVRGFTWHRSSDVTNPGTFAGLVEKIPYLQWLGVTAVRSEEHTSELPSRQLLACLFLLGKNNCND